jgi:hypothetical protein
MGTPVCELESKYFIEGEAHARGSKERKFLLWEFHCDETMQLAFYCLHLGY